MSKRKARMGRPPKRKADRQTERVVVRLTPVEHKRVKAEAKRDGLPLSAVLYRAWKEGG